MDENKQLLQHLSYKFGLASWEVERVIAIVTAYNNGDDWKALPTRSPLAEQPMTNADFTQDDARCESCGTTEDVVYGADPFAEDVHGDDTPVWMCGNCRYESAMDI